MASSAPTSTGLESPEALARLNAAIMGERNPRGIPSAVFVDSVDTFMDACGVKNIEPLVGALQQMYSKYKFMETSLQKNRETFKRKIPDTQKDLNMVRHLIAKRDEGETLQTQFNLSDNVYAKASVDCSVGKVCIWLGAQIMVEYPIDINLVQDPDDDREYKAMESDCDNDDGASCGDESEPEGETDDITEKVHVEDEEEADDTLFNASLIDSVGEGGRGVIEYCERHDKGRYPAGYVNFWVG
ncbi:hypothetical protein PPTG_10478 [Phytophthora nicotianae INRA-310]|uniref:Uncharacterized protein n=1 Tax=Phytophthora nicotianae (strain INRA-310) TaxID=761204 RepID=W2QH85_PHYN3|nr:hypothetical protein PPTG_10478 [Phytophthora nicotianae INRA-310]ETN11645.1 hypothetical protein PPTG_10478 [Phytophthora nicotianae INRA-310]